MSDGSGKLNGHRGGNTEAVHLGDEKTSLVGFLQYQRDQVSWKLRDVTDDVLRSVSTPAGMALHGLIRHLEHVERSWIRDDFAGETDLPYAWSDDGPDGGWHVDQTVRRVDLLREYAEESSLCDAIIADSSLNAISVRKCDLGPRQLLVALDCASPGRGDISTSRTSRRTARKSRRKLMRKAR